jgi:hypothetical protein
MLTYQGSVPQQLCKKKTDSTACADAAAWLEDARLLDQDLFTGGQHALKYLDLAPQIDDGLHATLQDE